MAGLKTVRPLPTPQLDQIDPFVFLNHHGPEHFGPNNRGLPFDPHPHRGMQTVTFIVDGDVVHRDNAGGESLIDEGGVQWMVAGEGLLHSETSSEKFKREGGDVEILQLWVNLPRDKKWVEPSYHGLSDEDMPVAELDEGRTRVKIVAGEVDNLEGAYQPLTDVEMYWVEFDEEGTFEATVDPSKNIFCYVVRGELEINGRTVDKMHLVEFGDAGERVEMVATEPSLLLWGHATPYDEPVVARGPFVMNTVGEIKQAMVDLREGRFGKWSAK